MFVVLYPRSPDIPVISPKHDSKMVPSGKKVFSNKTMSSVGECWMCQSCVSKNGPLGTRLGNIGSDEVRPESYCAIRFDSTVSNSYIVSVERALP